MTMEEYMRSVRTLTAAEVDQVSAVHDAEDLTSQERNAFDTGSFPTITASAQR